jgi:hypothetical protein
MTVADRLIDESTAHWLMLRVLGRPASGTRVVQYWTTSVLLFLPVLFVLPAFRSHKALGYGFIVVVGLLIYYGVVAATDRLYSRLNRKYGEPDWQKLYD